MGRKKDIEDIDKIEGNICRLFKLWRDGCLSDKDDQCLKRLISKWYNKTQKVDDTINLPDDIYDFSKYDANNPIQSLKFLCHSYKKTEIDRQADRIYSECPTIMQTLKTLKQEKSAIVHQLEKLLNKENLAKFKDTVKSQCNDIEDEEIEKFFNFYLKFKKYVEESFGRCNFLTRDNKKFWLRIPLNNDDEISKELKDDAFCGISFFDNLILWNPNYNEQKSNYNEQKSNYNEQKSSFFLYYHGNWNRAWKRGFEYMIQNKIPVKLPEKLLKLIQLLPFSQMSRECSQIKGHKLDEYDLKTELVSFLQSIENFKRENKTRDEIKDKLVDLGYSTKLAQKLLDLYDYLEQNNITKKDETFKNAQYYYFNQNVTFSNNEKQDAFFNNMSEEDDALNSIENLSYDKTEENETSEEVVASIKKCIDNNNDKIATAVLMNILSPYVAHIKFEALQNFISLDQKTYQFFCEPHNQEQIAKFCNKSTRAYSDDSWNFLVNLIKEVAKIGLFPFKQILIEKNNCVNELIIIHSNNQKTVITRITRSRKNVACIQALLKDCFEQYFHIS